MRTRRKKVPDAAVFDALVRVMMRAGPDELTLAAVAAEAGLTAGALVQRFGSKRELMLAHARHAAATGDIGVQPTHRATTALAAIRASVDPFAQLAVSPESALRNLAYLQRDLADPELHVHLLKMNRAARAHYRALVSDAVAAGELRANTDVAALARSIETILIGSFLTWCIHREGPAAKWIRRDLDAVLRPWLVKPRSR